MIVLLEYINLLQFYKQSTTNIWVGLNLIRPTLAFTTLLNNIDNIISTIEILYEVATFEHPVANVILLHVHLARLVHTWFVRLTS